MGSILPFSFPINLSYTGWPKDLWWFLKEAISTSQEVSFHFGGLFCTLMDQVLSVLFSQAHILKKLVSGWPYWSEQGAIWISTLSLPVANTRREKRVSLYFTNIFPPAVWRIRILLTQRGWMCLMTVMGFLGVSFSCYLNSLKFSDVHVSATCLHGKNQTKDSFLYWAYHQLVSLSTFHFCTIQMPKDCFFNARHELRDFCSVSSLSTVLLQSVWAFLVQNIFHTFITLVVYHYNFSTGTTPSEMEERKHYITFQIRDNHQFTQWHNCFVTFLSNLL